MVTYSVNLSRFSSVNLEFISVSSPFFLKRKQCLNTSFILLIGYIYSLLFFLLLFLV